MASGTGVHWKCTGDGNARSSSDGRMRIGLRFSHAVLAIVNRNRADSTGSQPEKNVTTCQWIIPGGMARVTCVSLVTAIGVGAPSFTCATRTYFTAPLTALQTKSTGDCTFVALLGGDTSSVPSS